MNGQKCQAPAPHNICTIVVTYHPDEGLPERIERILGQVDKVVIVDNHSSESCLAMIKNISSNLGIHLILNGENLGIATALNQGVRYAIDCGYSWALTLDQDTVPYLNMVQNLISAYNNCPFKEKVGIVGSNFQVNSTGKTLLHNSKYKNNSWLVINEVITSGSLISISIFEKIGSFRDDYFIDCVDFEYCFRLRANGYKIIIATKIGMIASLGNAKVHKFLWRTVMPYHYPPLRYYYKTRNGLLLAQEYFWKEIAWSLCRLTMPIRDGLRITLFEDNKILKLKYLCLGIYHALISKVGKLDE
ncbi:MAG: glycosyltransferase family 2 protein [Thermodesulfovibrionales bacterium]|nr:glycosyltransferase family 2 protein [Thermodesulfovibrionales bacterium]